MFYVGQKVVCIESWDGKGCADCIINLHQIYTIERFYHSNILGVPAVWLVNVADHAKTGDKGGYEASRFRPLTERKNDGEAFVRKLKEDCIPKVVEVV